MGNDIDTETLAITPWALRNFAQAVDFAWAEFADEDIIQAALSAGDGLRELAHKIEAARR